MKRILKLLLLFILVFALSKADGEVAPWVNLITYTAFGLSIAVLVGGFYYLLKVKKVKFLILFLAAFLSLSAQAGSLFETPPIDVSDILPADKSGYRLDDLGDSVCNAKRSGHLDLKALKQAQAIVDYWNKQGVSPGVLGGGDRNYECARNYIKYAAALGIASQAVCSPARMLLKTAAEKDKCWPCDVTATILAGIQQTVNKSYNAINNAAKLTLGVAFLIWLTVTILVSFAKFGFEKFGEFFTKLLNQTIVVMIVAVILHSPVSQFYRATISPFISYSAALSMKISEGTISFKGKSSSLFDKIVSKVGLANTGKCSYCDKIGYNESSSGNYLSSSAINSILCLTCTAYKQTAPMIAIGQNLVCIGRSTPIPVLNDIPVLNTISSFVGPNYQSAIYGLFLVLIFSVLTFLVGYFIMTSVLKLGVVLVLMPFFIVAFAFKGTRTYATKAWGLIVYSMAHILVVSLCISFITIGFSSLLPQASVLAFVNFFLGSDGSTLADMMGASNMMNDFALNAEGLQKLAGAAMNTATTMNLITLASFAYISIHIISNSASIAEQITNAWQLNSTEGQILSQSLIDSTKKGMAGAKGAWTGLKSIKAMRNGKQTQVNPKDIINEANKSLEKSQNSPKVLAPTKYTYDDPNSNNNGNNNTGSGSA